LILDFLSHEEDSSPPENQTQASYLQEEESDFALKLSKETEKLNKAKPKLTCEEPSGMKRKKKQNKDKKQTEKKAEKKKRHKKKNKRSSSLTEAGLRFHIPSLDKLKKYNMDISVSKEFEILNSETKKTIKPDFSYALTGQNLKKNRYGDALPNPETRVILKNGESDYINANYITGEKFSTSVDYIAAQAPLTNTFNDFWQMIFENETRVIMMLTRLQEKDRTKADVYWPRKGPLSLARGPGRTGEGEDSRWKQYGEVSVILERTMIHDDETTIRFFRLRRKCQKQLEHHVVQIHYTGWPDFGVPESPCSFLKLLDLMEQYNEEPVCEGKKNGPIVMHCSAGLGRTGTLIAAHIGMEQLRSGLVQSPQHLDMKAIVSGLREQRNGMVQTPSQYKFLHSVFDEWTKENKRKNKGKE